MNKYLVALCVDEPYISYSNYQIIEAINKQKACKKYNEINRCSYFYGKVIAKVNNAYKVSKIIDKLSNNVELLLELSFEKLIEKAEE